MSIAWGVASTASISHKFVAALQKLEGTAGAVAAVSSRDAERALEFIRKHSLASAACLTSELQCQTIDALYAPLPTALRCRLMLAAIERGMHVLGEKPAASNVRELGAVLSRVREEGVVYMDGTMMQHHPRLAALRRELREHVGPVRSIVCHMAFPGTSFEGFEDGIRMNAMLEPLGAIGDLGWYCVRALLFVMEYEPPLRVSSAAIHKRSQSGAPVTASATMEWEHTIAQVFCSFDCAQTQFLHVVGERGHLRVDDLVLPHLYNTCLPAVCEWDAHLDERGGVVSSRAHVPEESESLHPAMVQECAMLHRFAEMVRSPREHVQWSGISVGEHSNARLQTHVDYARVAWLTQLCLDAIVQKAEHPDDDDAGCVGGSAAASRRWNEEVAR